MLKEISLFIVLFLNFLGCFAQPQEIALTIDDLPFVGSKKNFHLNMILSTLQEYNVPATGFVIAGEVERSNWSMLKKFRDAGFGLGNHTVSHVNLNKIDAEAYIEEIDLADQLLLPLLSEPKYFRYPYLATGKGEKKEKVMHYLADHHYQVAPITIDSQDFLFNKKLTAVSKEEREDYLLNELKPNYLNYIWQQTLKAQEHNRKSGNPERAQILLIHANLLNAYSLVDIINLYREHGFTFVPLDKALQSFTTSSKYFAKNEVQINRDIESYRAWDEQS